MARSDNTHHTLSVLVENTPGVLTRVASLFSRRGFNIETLAVGPTERDDRSRITIRVDCSELSIDQVVKQLYKLINVLKVNQMTTEDAIERELMLVKVTASPDKRGDLIHLAEVFGARVSDVGAQALMFEIVEHPDKLASFEELLRPYGIKETIRTGRIAMRRALGERRDRDAAACASSPERMRLRSNPLDRGQAPRDARHARPPRRIRTRNPMTKVYYDADADRSLLDGKKIAVVGYGSQGHAHALNLKDSGFDVTVGIRPDSEGWKRAEDDGWAPKSVADAVADADVIGILVPDHVAFELWESTIGPALKPGSTVLFAHGFSIHFRRSRRATTST